MSDPSISQGRVFFYNGPVTDVAPFLFIFGLVACTISLWTYSRFSNKPQAQAMFHPIGKKFTLTCLITLQVAHFASSLMATCDFYNERGTFASTKPVGWALKATFITTALTTFIFQMAIISFLGRRMGRIRVLCIPLSITFALAALVCCTGYGLVGQEHPPERLFRPNKPDGLTSLGSYVSAAITGSAFAALVDFMLGLSLVAGTTSLPVPVVAFLKAAIFSIWVVRQLCSGILLSRGTFAYSIAILFSYEFIGNVYPAFWIAILYLAAKHDSGAKVDLIVLQADVDLRNLDKFEDITETA